MIMSPGLHPSFQHQVYLFRRKVLKLFGGAFYVYDEKGDLVFYSKQKAFKLREDFRVYADEHQKEELLAINTQHIIDIGATYQVKDTTTQELVGSIQRKALKSLIKDEWIFLSKEGKEMGKLTETSTAGALLSRFINLIPQRYVVISKDGREQADIQQHFNLLILKYTMVIKEPEPSIDRRLLIAMGILLAGIERRQG